MKMLLGAMLSAYLAYVVVMVVLHPRFIYPFQSDDRVLPGFERVELTAENGFPIYVQERKGAGPVVLYLMGNAGAVPLFDVAFDGHRAADRHIVALEYRGGAGRPGAPSEAVLKADALIAADYALSKNKPLIVQGYSLGTGLATHVAARRNVDRVVLSAPYDRLCKLMSVRARLPACLLPFVQKWNSIEDARKIEAPILVLHGAEDALIMPSSSRKFAELPNVTRLVIDGAGHADLSAFPAYRSALEEFLEPPVQGGS